MRIAVLGAGGLLGRHLATALTGAGHRADAFDRAACDIGDRAAVERALGFVDAVVSCAAFTNVDKAETEVDAAWRANALGAEHVGKVAQARGLYAIHVSTDFVFDGVKATPYDELDTPNPRSVYARSKLGGEQLFLRACPSGLVVRVQGLYGQGGANFASKLPELLRAKKPLSLDGERRVQPTSAHAAAAQLVHLLALAPADRVSGLAHVSCSGATTWAGYTRRLAEQLGLTADFTEVSTAQLAAPAARPPNCLFEHRMLKLRGHFLMPSWEAAQDAYLGEIRAA
jgi:dTDP-4-dehydrorhamnose reductase